LLIEAALLGIIRNDSDEHLLKQDLPIEVTLI
jgi:hypothetical protein